MGSRQLPLYTITVRMGAESEDATGLCRFVTSDEAVDPVSEDHAELVKMFGNTGMQQAAVSIGSPNKHAASDTAAPHRHGTRSFVDRQDAEQAEVESTVGRGLLLIVVCHSSFMDVEGSLGLCSGTPLSKSVGERAVCRLSLPSLLCHCCRLQRSHICHRPNCPDF